MAAAVTYQGDAHPSGPSTGGLFAGQKLFFAQNVPSRRRFIDEATANGAQIVPIEKQADVILVDHMKKHQVPNSFSYRYVERSIWKGELEDLEAHRVGSAKRSDRPVGSVVTASKGGRNKFTDADDQILWNWIKPFANAGGHWKGNEIYKQLEDQYPHHTYQSWRDRWGKYTQFQKRRVTEEPQLNRSEVEDELEASPRRPKRQRTGDRVQRTTQQANIGVAHTPHVQPNASPRRRSEMGNSKSTQAGLQPKSERVPPVREAQNEANVENDAQPAHLGTHQLDKNTSQPTADFQDSRDVHTAAIIHGISDLEDSVSVDGNRLPLVYNFTQDEALMLYKAAPHILDARADKLDESWTGVTKEYGHTKDAWQSYFYDVIVPEFKKRHGLATDDELRAYCRTQIKKERKIQRQGHPVGDDSQDTGTVREQKYRQIHEQGGNADTSIDRSAKDLHYTNHVGMKIEAQKMEDERETETQLSMSHPPIPAHRPPQPNESRKLSQGKASQSTSSQSRSLSISQPSQASQIALLGASVAGRTDANTEASNFRHIEPQHHVISSIQVSTYEQTDNALQSQLSRPDLHPSLPVIAHTSQNSEAPEEHSSRLVTQFSQTRQSSTTDSEVDLPDIPYKAITPPQQNARSESPLFFPEESEHSTSGQRLATANENRIQLRGDSPIVGLFEDEGAEIQEHRTSEYTPSEAPSEGVQFEGQVLLSQPWETAPEGVLAEGSPDIQMANYDDQRSSQDHLFVESGSMESGLETGKDLVRDDVLSSAQQSNADLTENALEENTEAGYETAPTRQLTEHSAYSQDGDEDEDSNATQHRVSQKPANRLETQALFQQATQINFTEITAMPEPPGGWDDDETPSKAVEEAHQEVVPAEDADWTLPLPDPDHGLEHLHMSATEEVEGSDIGNWLAEQVDRYPAIPAPVLKPIAHRALESSSMDLNFANAIVTRMTQRFAKGKQLERDGLSWQHIQTLPSKRERRSAISDLVGELVPTDMRGCWTKEDDEALFGVNGREVKRVEDKHGEESVRSRFEFLEMWNAK